MKGIAISIMAAFLITIVSITVLISFFITNMPNTLNNIYCSILKGSSTLLPLPGSRKPSLPSFCLTPQAQKVVYIESSVPERISFELASYIMACWEVSGKLNLDQNVNCYEVVIKRIEGKIDEESVVAKLPKDYKQIIDWKTGSITTPKSIGIFYNSTTKLIMVV